MKWMGIAAIFVMVVAFSGCANTRMSAGGATPAGEVSGLLDAYVSVGALRPYDGTIFSLDLVSQADKPDELFAVDVWPVVGFGFGIFGARFRLVMLEAAFGMLWYHPQPPVRQEEGTDVETRADTAGSR
jgi:hypothetical protein